MISGLFTGLLDFGGVQRVGKHAATILQRIAQDDGSQTRILGMSDAAGEHLVTIDGVAFNVRGFGYHRLQFAVSTVKALIKSRVVYVAHPNLAPLALAAKLLRPNLRYVVATHGVEVWQPLSRMQRWALRRADRVTAPSEFTAEHLRSIQRVDPARVVIVPWAIEPRLIVENGHRKKLNLPAGKLLLTVGRIAASEQLKGVDTVIRALPAVLKEVPETHYIVLGDGDDRARLEQLARDCGVEERVMFVGWQEDEDDLMGYYDACDVFVMPSKQEGFGLVFLEAMARRKPVIAANHGGALDIVEHGVTGFLVEYDDAVELARQISKLLRTTELRDEMGAAGRKRVERNFSFEIFERRLRDVLGCPKFPLPQAK